MAEYKINQEIADEITRFVYAQTGYHTIVCNENAVIIGDSAGTRLGITHTGAQRILRGEVDAVFVGPEDVAKNPSMKEGQNYPVSVEGVRVGTFGIAGKMEYTQPIAKVVTALFSSRLKGEADANRVQQVAGTVSENVQQAAAAIEEMSASSEEMAATTDRVAKISDETVKKVKETNKIIDMSRSIATQTKLLSLNASIEAARAGIHGRGFAVVAQEMQKLAQSSAEATENINKILGEIQASITSVIEGINQSAAVSAEQARAMQEIIHMVETVQASTTTLVQSFKKK
ncbi:methyl-accepting chemotaxis protein [Sporomusa malonica]|uniref:Putative sugar diacid recognition n=1 Tax=Sporomusa malonica TaxID=112901 RepID=A0A1W2E2Z8_9FIRM|nr:methyl-accepting chemotaxis protein [Sporomusa malonica]SMD04201.1 Putative sugar diacid recognition [Sporomusa malonica]